jgi:hypothetical protein
VTFEDGEPYKLASPTWRPLSLETVAAMIGDQERPQPFEGQAPGRSRDERVYVAERRSEMLGDIFVSVEEDGQQRPLPHVMWHSPTGYEWHFGGSGPADLALSILADYLDEQPTHDDLSHGKPQCWILHQAFKWAFIAPAPYEGFRLPAREIAAWLERHAGAADDTD